MTSVGRRADANGGRAPGSPAPGGGARAAKALASSAEVFAALGDEQRLRLVMRLCDEGPLSISRLTEGADVTRQAVTKHLRVLEAAGLAHGSREGREMVWELHPRKLDEVRKHLGVISAQWDDAIERLRRFVEEDA